MAWVVPGEIRIFLLSEILFYFRCLGVIIYQCQGLQMVFLFLESTKKILPCQRRGLQRSLGGIRRLSWGNNSIKFWKKQPM